MIVTLGEDSRAYLTLARHLELIFVVTDPENVIQHAKEARILSVQYQMLGDFKYFSVVYHVRNKNCLQHFSRRINTTQEADRAEEAPMAAETGKTRMAKKGIDHYGRLSQTVAIITQILQSLRKGICR